VTLRRHAVSIALSAVAIGLGVYVVAVDRGRPTADEAQARKRNLFASFRRGDITAIEISGGAEPLRITRAPGDGGEAVYYVAAATPEVADQAAVDRLISALEIAVPERRIEVNFDRRTLGVDSPKLRVAISMGRTTYRLAVGNSAPSPAGAAYAEIEGEGSFVVSRDLVADLLRPRDGYRTRTLVPYSPSDLVGLNLEGEGGARRFSRGRWGGFQIAIGQGNVRVDREAFDRVLASLSDLRTESFLSDPQADEAIGKAESRIRIVVTPKDPLPRAVLDVGGSCSIARDGADKEGTVAIRREPGPRVSGCVAKDAVQALATPADRLADRHPFSLRPDEIEEISLVMGETGTEIARKGTSWHMRRPTEGTVEIEEGNGLARSLGDLFSAEIEPAPAADAGGFPARAQVTLRKAGEAGGDEVVLMGPTRADGLVVAMRAQDGARLAFSTDAAKALVPGPLTLKTRRITEEDLTRVKAISIRWEKWRQMLHRLPAGTWTLDEPRGFAPDPGLANDLAETLAQLHADRWLAESDDGSYGLSAPSRTIDLEVADADAGARNIHLEVGRSIARGAAAKRADDPAVFLLPAAALRAIDTLAIDRSSFMVDPAEVEKIDLGRKRRLLGRDLEAAKEALSAMRAEGVVHLGPPRLGEGFDRPELAVTIDRTGARAATRLLVGSGDVWRETNVFYARRDGVDATFAIAQSKVRPLLDLR
jgi:hypothetical protein